MDSNNSMPAVTSAAATVDKHRCIISRISQSRGRRWNVRNILVATLFLSLFIGLLSPNPNDRQLVEGAKLKKEAKKALISLAKGFVVNKLTTRKNFMPLPVPIPVPIELSEPPVYLKGKPKYVNVYKATTPAVVKPTTVYHMPVYSPTYQEYSTSMMDPMGMYGPMMAASGRKAYGGYAGGYGSMMKHSMSGGASDPAVESALNSADFNDFDDDSSNYYTRKSSSIPKRKHMSLGAAFGGAYGGSGAFSSRSDGRAHQIGPLSSDSRPKSDQTKSSSSSASAGSQVSILDEKESIDETDRNERSSQLRVKRQINYQSGYEGHEEPCYGFPLEVNVKSRIKLDGIFPIHGKSQHKKCIKVGRPLLPPVEEESRHPYK